LSIIKTGIYSPIPVLFTNVNVIISDKSYGKFNSKNYRHKFRYFGVGKVAEGKRWITSAGGERDMFAEQVTVQYRKHTV
jgi:hypothetical protein